MCAKSCNTENEERLFGQAKAIALNTTNRRLGNILPNILLRLQAKQQVKELFKEQGLRVTRLVLKPGQYTLPKTQG